MMIFDLRRFSTQDTGTCNYRRMFLQLPTLSARFSGFIGMRLHRPSRTAPLNAIHYKRHSKYFDCATRTRIDAFSSFSMSLLSSNLLTGTGLIHCAFGLAVPELRVPLTRVLSEGTTQVDDVGDRYQRECSFWYQFGGLMMISHGFLLRHYCQETGRSVPKWFGWYLTGLSTLGVFVMPESGFWLVLGQGLYILYAQKGTSDMKTE
jgi:Family of unknown function (DUF6463)